MGGEIIAEKFALLKTRGSNGVSCTHIVEDTLLGQRAVVKVSDKLGILGLDYLKTINLAREANIPCVLMPFEGGILEEESGYYLAFPELGEPSLENYLRIGAPLTCREIVEIGEQMLAILETLHEAGFFHLFINTRNVFYRPRNGITLKDPALRREYFHPLLELVATPDFYYFSPEVMDGVLPGAEADLYALGRLISRLLEAAVDTDISPEEPLASWLAERCCSDYVGSEALSSAALLLEISEAKESLSKSGRPSDVCLSSEETEQKHSVTHPPSPGRSRSPRGWRNVKTPGMRIFLVFIIALVLTSGIAIAYLFTGEEEKAPAQGGSGGSVAGELKETIPFEDMSRTGMETIVSDHESTGIATEASDKTESIEDKDTRDNDETQYSEPIIGGSEDGGHIDSSEDTLPAGPSPLSPVASFSVSPGEGQSPLQVHLDASSSYDPDGTIVSYAWSCGGSGACLYHVFESNVIPATMAITLTVTDDGGHTASSTQYVILY
jgi:serine/threonine protein kinase